jgi:hypothetical protein
MHEFKNNIQREGSQNKNKGTKDIQNLNVSCAILV